MHEFPLRQPLLPSHYTLWFDPPDEKGDEALHIVSERRTLKLKGRAFREFHRHVVPLLDGGHSLREIVAATQEHFRAEDLAECLELLRVQGIVVEGDTEGLSAESRIRMQPQLNLFHDLAPGRDLQDKLANATVAVIGLGGAGAGLGLALAAAGVGTIRCVDNLPVASADGYLSPFLGLHRLGSARADVVRDLIHAAAPEVKVETHTVPMQGEDDLRGVVAGADIVACCLDASQANLAYKLNRVCLAGKLRWITCSLAGAEVIVGPTFHPGSGPCYLCYRMRSVACAGNPEDAFALERHLDRHKRDDSGRRENLVFGAGMAANFMGLEIVKELTELTEPSLTGRLLSIQLTDLLIERHTVLRKPWCPACSPTHGNDIAA